MSSRRFRTCRGHGLPRRLALMKRRADSGLMHVGRVILTTWTATNINCAAMNERTIIEFTARAKIPPLAHLLLLPIVVKCNHPLGARSITPVFGLTASTFAFATLTFRMWAINGRWVTTPPKWLLGLVNKHTWLQMCLQNATNLNNLM